MADVVLAVIVFAPVLITLVLRSNAALSFLTLSASFTLITFASADIKDLTGTLNLQINAGTLNLILLVFPLLLTLLLTRKAFSGRLQQILHGLTAFCAGGLLALVSIPLLNASIRSDFAGSWGWENLQKIQAPLIAAGVILSLFIIWFFNKRPKRHK